jgi:hypothetical protein
MKQKPITLILLVLFITLLAGCNRPAEITATPLPLASETAVVVSPTEKPTEAPSQATAPAQVEIPVNTPVITVTVRDSLAFVADVTIPDGTTFLPGEAFEKTWRLRNEGVTTWTEDYSLIFDGGSIMGGPIEMPLPAEVAPGEEIEITVELTAPDTPGEHIGYWMLRNGESASFGSGGLADDPFWVAIVVLTEDGQLPEFSGSKVTYADLIINQENYQGPCPVTLTFTGDLLFDGEGDLTYQFEAGASEDLKFVIPEPQTVTFDQYDIHTLTLFFTLELTRSVEGWAKVTVLSPNNLSSTPINFKVTCNP